MGPSAWCCLPQRMWAMEATLGRAGVLARGYSFCQLAVWRVAVEAEVVVVRLWSAVRAMVIVVVLLRLEMEGLLRIKVLGAFAL